MDPNRASLRQIPMTTSTKKILLGALVVPAIALAAACTSGNNDNRDKSASADSGGTAPAASAPLAEPGTRDGIDELSAESADVQSLSRQDAAFSTDTDAKGDAAPADSPQPAQTLAQRQSVISKGQISLHSKDVDKTRFALQQVLDALDGTIDDEQSNADKQGKTIRQRLVLRVPATRFGKAMDQLSKLPGSKLVSRSRSSKDVTTEVIDNATRVRTQRASLARVQALLAQATSLREVISIESQLSRRQADLDSLEAQQKYLADQTSLSTINVYLSVPDKKKSAHKDDDSGFFSGFKSGWDHLGTSTSAVLTGIGAVIPFAALAALIGFPAWAAWRRRTVRTAPAEA
jgi:hypothetical protein